VAVTAIHLYPNILEELFQNDIPHSILESPNKDADKTIVAADVISKYIESLDFYFQNPTLVNNDILELKIKELILLLIQTNTANSITELFQSLFSPRTYHIKTVIEKHLFSNVSVQDLAMLCNMSLSAFKREFKSIYSTSPLLYLNGQRIKKAKELLQVSDLSIGEIATTVGITDPLYFTRLFKKIENTTPSEFRKAKQL